MQGTAKAGALWVLASCAALFIGGGAGSAQAQETAAQAALSNIRGTPASTTWPFDAAEAGRRQATAAAALGIPVEKTVDLGGGVTMKFRLIPAGEFDMGSPETETDRRADEGPLHRVRITAAFYMAATEVTQAQWTRVTGGNPSTFRGSDDLPVDNVDRKLGLEFAEKLSARIGEKCRLPTEAEWEYACRAGSSARFSFGNDDKQLGDYAWIYGNSGLQTHPVARKRPNAWGLYDMYGNLLEAVMDPYDENYYKNSPAEDPHGPGPEDENGKFVMRGGCWDDIPICCRSAARLAGDNSFPMPSHGCRVVLLAPAGGKK